MPSTPSILLPKFSVPVTCYISLNLQKLLVHSANQSSCSDDIKRSCKPGEKIDGHAIRSRCDEYKAEIAKCPKTTYKTYSQIPPLKCNSKISDTYLKSVKSIE
ncbi:uncharacterized protein LOC117171169 [Belonocnema kinseyi]|uniref:uncharacterized protein LOC117171169 n=1 Tax=Belonocnema kinseyi TaxID=2817044 RepID=UPI00143E0C0C|nr:uncharacterized protein LOC117171169 [Belonocnema kinseyi]